MSAFCAHKGMAIKFGYDTIIVVDCTGVSVKMHHNAAFSFFVFFYVVCLGQWSCCGNIMQPFTSSDTARSKTVEPILLDNITIY